MDASSPVPFLVGPTASGKSVLALAVAERAGAEVLSLDSMQVYRGLDVGTAKPGPADRARVPHHLLDLAEPSERYHVHRYLEDFRRALADVRGRGRRALVVGGTGLYLRALAEGLSAGPPHDEALRRELGERAAREGLAALHAELARADPAAAERIHANDEKRVLRGLEVLHASGKPLSEWQREGRAHGEGIAARRVVVGLEVETARLDARIRARAEAMLDLGWVEEARAVREGPGFGPTARQALGYAEVLLLADGEIGREECLERIALRTRQFARRQRTWFRSFPEVRRIAPGSGAEAVERALGW